MNVGFDLSPNSHPGMSRVSDYGDGVDGARLGIECAMMVVVETDHQRSAVHGEDYITS